MFISKKGVSPLIATILLIAFAVALGSVVMNWGLHLELGESPDRCRNVEIRLRNIDETSEACFGGFGQNGYINFIIDNTGASEVNGLAIWITGDKSTNIFDLDNILIRKGQLYDKNDREVSYDFSANGNIKTIQFIPKISAQDSYELCPRAAAKAERVSICKSQPQ